MKIGLSLLLALPLLTGCVYAPLSLDLEGLGQLKEVTLHEGEGDHKLLVIPIDGEITSSHDDGLLGSTPATTSMVKKQLDLARRDESVRGVLLRINSPGGGVTASDVIWHELRRFRKETGKPVVAFLYGTAASGGYYVAMGCDRVIGAPTTVTGSIGVIAVFPEVSGLGKKIGVDVTALTSGKNKDMGSMFRPMRRAERRLFQQLIDEMYARFVKVVALGRDKAGLSEERVKRLADGRIYTIEQALSAKLVDEVAYIDVALERLAKLAKVSAPSIVSYQTKGLSGTVSTVYGSSSAGGLSLKAAAPGGPALELLQRAIPRASGPVFKYLWAPGRK